MLFGACCKNNSASDKDTGIIEEIKFPEFSPFMDYYRKYKTDMSFTAKIACMTNGMKSLRNNDVMRVFINKMFDFEMEVDELESEIFSVPARMEITFNYIDLCFQLYSSSSDQTFKLVARHLNDLRRYYNKKSSL